MKVKGPVEFQTFNDGVCAVYRTKNVAEPGDAPKEQLEVRYPRIPFECRKVGLTRYWQAVQADVKVTDLIRIPHQMRVSTNDVCVISGIQYRIEQVQAVLDTQPPATDLTLSRLEADYDIKPVS